MDEPWQRRRFAAPAVGPDLWQKARVVITAAWEPYRRVVDTLGGEPWQRLYVEASAVEPWRNLWRIP